MKVKPYLVFNGNAKEVANRYAEILGGKIEELTLYGDCMPDTPEEHKSKVFMKLLPKADRSDVRCSLHSKDNIREIVSNIQ